MNIVWKRGDEKISFSYPSLWFVLGFRGTAKSTFLETLGERYLEKGCAVLDLFGKG